MKFLKYILVLIFLSIACKSYAGDITVTAQVESKDIYIGENFSYHIIISGENKAGQPDLSALSIFNPQSAGNRDVSQTSISIINGKTTKNIVKQYVMSYLLNCGREGLIEIPSVKVTIDGKDYQTNPVQVNILKPGTTDMLDLETLVSQQNCYVGQPVIFTVNFYVSADIGDFQFNIPALNDEIFYIEDPDVTNQQAKEYRLDSTTTAMVTQSRVSHNGKESILVSFSKVLVPKNPGDIVLAASSVSADVAVRQTRSRDEFFGDFFGQKQYKRFMVSSAPLKLSVLPLPEQNKPSQFYGLVGKYSITASATPTKVNVGDPITLAVKIGGSKYLKAVQWPELEQIPEFASNFKIPSQKASPVLEDDYKIFTQTIRANNDKVTEIPPISLFYFDSDKGQYVAAKSEPIKLEVSPSKILTGADIEGNDFTPINKEVEAIKKGLSANYEGPDVLKDMNFSLATAILSPAYLFFWGLPFLGLIVSSFAKVLTNVSPEQIAIKRRRQACGKAIANLKKIQSAAQKNELLAAAMKQFIGEKFDKQAGSLTAEDCHQIILSSTNDSEAAEKYRDIIARCEAARYGSVQANIDSAKINEIIELIRQIDKKAPK